MSRSLVFIRSMPVGVVISPESELGKELAKWETPKRHGGMGPNGYERYPKMLYKATERQGRAIVNDPWDESISAACQYTVQNESEHLRLKSQGWSDTPLEALDAWEAERKRWADEAANAAHHAARMSEPAQREYRQADEATHEHVVDVQPRKRPGPKPKTKPVTVTGEE